MSQIKPTLSRLLVFHPINKRLMEGSKFIHKPRSYQGNMQGVQEHWVLDAGPLTEYEYAKGSKVMTENGACFVQTQHIDLWEHYVDDPAFAELKELQETTQCDVETRLMYESRVIMADLDRIIPRQKGDSHDRTEAIKGQASKG